MDGRPKDTVKAKKMTPAIDREINTAVFLLRASQLGLSMADLEILSIGMVLDMLIEKQNDDYDYPVLATQADIDRL